MASGKKYDIRIIPKEAGYTAQFIRHRAVRRRNERAIDEWLKSLSYKEIAEVITQEHEHAAAGLQKLKWDTESLWNEVAYRVMKNGGTQQVALSLANEEVGKNWTQRFEKALAGELDHTAKGVEQIAIDNAKRILAIGQKMDRSE